jgi:mannose-1-phosphate guanylyltransferase
MPGSRNEKHHWGVILAGGDGTRLKPLTHLVSNDDRPKQFCPLLGGKTLLAQTRLRIAGSVNPGRTLFLLNKVHEPFYKEKLAKVSPVQMVVQPSNRGTLPAILWSLLHIVRLDEDAVVAFFPSDHYYSQEDKFRAGIASGFELAESHPQNVILLGAVANRPEIEYGWIEPETNFASPFGNELRHVKRFWEKPSYQVAQSLLDRGCLWNTFVMVGRAGAFLTMIKPSAPIIYRAFESILTLIGPEMEADLMRPIYDRLPVADFSRLVLTASTERLCVASLGDIGWSDLGDPQRLVTALFAAGMENQWVTSGSCNRCGINLANPAVALVSASGQA